MEAAKAFNSISQPQAGWSRTASARTRGCTQRHPVGAANRRRGKIFHNAIHPIRPCHRWFQRWSQQGVFKAILTELDEDLYQRGGIDIRETFIDGSFTPAKKGVVLSAIQSAAKAPRSWQLQTLMVFLSPATYKALHPTK